MQRICTNVMHANHYIHTTVKTTDEFRNVSVTVTLMCRSRRWAWLAGRGGRGRHTLSIEDRRNHRTKNIMACPLLLAAIMMTMQLLY